MTFVQEYKRYEKLFGWKKIRIVVSDDYEMLSKTNAQIASAESRAESEFVVDVLNVESSKKQLQKDDGKFAIDEMELSIHQSACESDAEKNALFFLLEAKEVYNHRFIAAFFLKETSPDVYESPSDDNLDFIGKINDKVTGDDDQWDSEEYDKEIDPYREYKFTAYSFDISLLEKATLTKPIYDVYQNPISNIYERISDSDMASIFRYRLSYRGTASDVYIRPLASLYDTLDMYLGKASALLNELVGTTFTFNIVETSLGFQVCAMNYEPSMTGPDAAISGTPKVIYNGRDENNKKIIRLIELKLNSTHAGSEWSNPFVHRRLIDEEYGQPSGYDRKDLHKNMIANEASYSFKSLENVSDILFEVARNFGLFIKPKYTTGTNIDIEFKSRKNIVESQSTYVIDITDGGIDTKAEFLTEGRFYYGLANNCAPEGRSEIDSISNSDSRDASENVEFKRLLNEVRYYRDKKYDVIRLYLTLSNVIQKGKSGWIQPLNIVLADDYNYDTYDDQYFNDSMGNIEKSSTAIYVQTVPGGIEETAEVDRYGADKPIWRPAFFLHVNINGKNYDADDKLSLSKYLNLTDGVDEVSYETEYKLTVPFWSGFSKNSDGSNPSMWNVDVGSKIPIREKIKRRNPSTGVWEDYIPDQDAEFVVVGVERSYDEPETTLELNLSDKFAYGLWDPPTPGAVPPPPEELVIEPKINTETVEGDTSAYQIGMSSIDSGYIVMVDDDGKIVLSIPKHPYFGRTIGALLEAGSLNQYRFVQKSGRVFNYAYDFEMGKQLFVGTNETGLNITQQIPDIPNGIYNMLIYLGLPDCQHSFTLDKHEFPYVAQSLDYSASSITDYLTWQK